MWRLMTAAAVSAAAFAALGWWVTHHSLSRPDVLGGTLYGERVSLAIAFTNSGYGMVLTVLGGLTVGAALELRAAVTLPVAILISQLASQLVVNAAKGLFRRTRPDAWLFRHELGFSYPSGHAATAIVFYGAWLAVLWTSPLPLPARAVGAFALGVWALGIGWSRIALGAHYLTDVLGGFLLGTAWLCAAWALVLARAAGLVTRHA
jgi:undecaprenyl-diphosphatase